MDTVTQFALGACVGVAVLGRKIGPGRAALVGGILGTLPDLDVFLAPDDPIESFVQHRGWSHSLFVHAALAPVIGEGVRLCFKALRPDRLRAWTATFLCLSTHALLDAVTIYGTRLFWPFSTDPVSVGSIFIIDPLYSLPLLFAMIGAFFQRRWTARFGRVLAICLGLSTTYLGWTIAAQQIVADKTLKLLAAKNITPERMIATPTPFNSFLWRAIVIEGGRSYNLYLPVIGGAGRATLYGYDRNLRFETCPAIAVRAAKVAEFSRGFYRLLVQDGTVSIADLRMGLTPAYAFRFDLGRFQEGRLVAAPTRRIDGRGNIGEDLDWLIANVKGMPATRPAEAAAQVAITGPDTPAASNTQPPPGC